MKIKLVLCTLLCVAIIIPACKKDTKKEVETESNQEIGEKPDLGSLNYDYSYKSLLIEFTSTGCPGCGSWGKPTFYGLANKYKNEVIPLAAHIKYGDPMITKTSELFADNRTGSRYTPQIWVNEENAVVITSGNSIDGTASIRRADSLITTASKTEIVGLGGVLLLKNEKIFTKFGVQLKPAFQSGEYYVNAYLTEDGIKAEQLSYANNPATHNYVLRHAAFEGWGNKINKEVGAQFTKDWEFSFEQDINSSQYLIVVLWKKVGGIYVPVNALKIQ